MIDPTLVQRLSAELSSGLPLQFAVLFGSRARGRERTDSDLDIGILPMNSDLSLEDELKLQGRLSRATGVDVDLVRLDGEDLLLAREAVTHGVLLHESRPGAFARFRARAIGAWLDFETSLMPARNRWLARVARQGVP